MRNGRAIGLLLGTHLAAVNPKPQGLTLSDRSNIEKATVGARKEIRGAAGETKAETATRDTTITTAPFASDAKKIYTAEEKRVCSI
jgi:hypothetical protein